MAQFTVDIPDDLITDYLTALTGVNQRQHAAQRQPEPLTFGAEQVQKVIEDYMFGVITTNAQDEHLIDGEVTIRALRTTLEARRQDTP